MDNIVVKIEDPDSDDCQMVVKGPSHSMKKMQPYAIVLFTDEGNAPGIICSRWLLGKNKSYYPNVRTNEARDRILRKNRPHQPDWPLCRVKVLQLYSTFNEARSHLNKAEETSSLESEEEKQKERPRRKRKPRSLLLPGEINSDEDTSLAPPSKKVPSCPKSSGKSMPSAVIPRPSQHSTTVYVPTSVPSQTDVTAVIPGPSQQSTTVYVLSVPSATGVTAVPSQKSTAVYVPTSVPSATSVIQSPSQQPATVQAQQNMDIIDKRGVKRGQCTECDCQQYERSEEGKCGYCYCPPTKHKKIETAQPNQILLNNLETEVNTHAELKQHTLLQTASHVTSFDSLRVCESNPSSSLSIDDVSLLASQIVEIIPRASEAEIIPRASEAEIIPRASEAEIFPVALVKVQNEEQTLPYPCPLPKFSPAVRKMLEGSAVVTNYGPFVREAAAFLLSLVERPSKSDYDEYCFTLYEKYRYINLKGITGRALYGFLKKKLTHSIRNSRYYLKRKDCMSSTKDRN